MGLKDYSTQERLNKMNVDLIDVDVTLSDGSAYLADDLFFAPTEIPGVTEISNGGCIIQSVTCIGSSTDGNETGDFDLIIATQNIESSLTKSGPAVMVVNDPMSGNIGTVSSTAALSSICGIIKIENMIDMGSTAIIGSADNIGIVAKPKNTSLWVFGITRATDTWASPFLRLRFGIVRD